MSKVKSLFRVLFFVFMVVALALIALPQPKKGSNASLYGGGIALLGMIGCIAAFEDGPRRTTRSPKYRDWREFNAAQYG